MSSLAPEECKSELQELLGESIVRATNLREILAHERIALERQDSTALDAAATGKQECVDRLNELDEKRGEISVSCGFDKNPHDMTALTDWCDDGSSTVRLWEEFIEIARRCAELNSVNGSILHVRRQQVQNTLSLLRSSNSNTDTYGSDGLSASNPGTRSLTEA